MGYPVWKLIFRAEGVKEVTLATFVSAIGLGLVQGPISSTQFWNEYWKGTADILKIEGDLNKAADKLREAQARLLNERPVDAVRDEQWRLPDRRSTS